MPGEKQTRVLEDGTILFQCSKCKEFKPREDYAVDKRAKYGIQSKCKACHDKYYYSDKERYNKNTQIRYLCKRDHISKEDATKIIESPKERKQKYRERKGELILCKGCSQFLLSKEFPPKQTLCKKCYAEKKKQYNWEHKEDRSKYKKEYVKTHQKELAEYNKKNKEYKSEKARIYSRVMSGKYGFSWSYFHKKTLKFIKSNNIIFKSCVICGGDDPILHHPSYEGADMREYVVPLCPQCHRRVHAGRIDCPEPIKLTDLVNKKQNDLGKNIRTISKGQARGEDISIGESPKANEKKSLNEDKK